MKILLSFLFLVCLFGNTYADNNKVKNVGLGSAEESMSAENQVIVVQTETASVVELSGFVLRADGSHTVWINGESELSRSSHLDARVGNPSPRSTTVPVHARKKSTLLKPGQVWLLDEQRIDEVYRVNKEALKEAERSAGDYVSDNVNDNVNDSVVNSESSGSD